MHSRGTDPPQPFFNRLGCSRNFGQRASDFEGGTKQERTGEGCVQCAHGGREASSDRAGTGGGPAGGFGAAAATVRCPRGRRRLAPRPQHLEQTLLMPDYDDDGGWGGYLAVDPKRPGRRLVRVQGASHRGRDGRDRLLHVRPVRGTRPRQEHGTGRSSPRRFRRTSYAAGSRTRCPRTTRRPPSCGAWGWGSSARCTISRTARSGVGGSNPGTRLAEDRPAGRALVDTIHPSAWKANSPNFARRGSRKFRWAPVP